MAADGGARLNWSPATRPRQRRLQFPDDVVERLSLVQGRLPLIGRDPVTVRLSVALTTVVGRDDAECAGRLAAVGADGDELVALLTGTPDQVVDRSATPRPVWGRFHLQLRDLGDLDPAELIAAKVVSQRRGIGGARITGFKRIRPLLMQGVWSVPPGPPTPSPASSTCPTARSPGRRRPPSPGCCRTSTGR